jgi:hypothetical protein
LQFDPGPVHPGQAAHQGIDRGDVERDVVERGRSRQDRQAVVGRIAAQEHHEIAQPVRKPEAQHVAIPLLQRLVRGRMEHDVADAQRRRQCGRQLAHRPLRTVGDHFEGMAVGIEGPEAVASRRTVQFGGLADDLRARTLHLGKQGIDIGPACRRIADQIGLADLVLAQADHVRMRRPYRRGYTIPFCSNAGSSFQTSRKKSLSAAMSERRGRRTEGR